MNTTIIDRKLRVCVTPAASVEAMYRRISIRSCRCPRIRPIDADYYWINVQLVPVLMSIRDQGALRHEMFEILLRRRLRVLTLVEAFCFNEAHGEIQRDHPFFISCYAFGKPNFDPYDTSQRSYGEGEFHSLTHFCRLGTSRHLLLATTQPTEVDRGILEEEIVLRDIDALG